MRAVMTDEDVRTISVINKSRFVEQKVSEYFNRSASNDSDLSLEDIDKALSGALVELSYNSGE